MSDELKEEEIPFFEVLVTDDFMRADIVFHKPSKGCEAMSFSDVIKEIHDMGLVIGVREDIIQKVMILQLYERKVSFCYGIPAVPGKDGYYEYFFKRKFNRRPVIKEDGNADYRSLETFALVEAGQKLCVYHERELSKKGANVFGDVIEVRESIDMPPYTGTGFHVDRDGVTYVSSIAGKVEIVEGKLSVSPVHEVMGDVCVLTGNIEFDGNVIVHGKVRSGMKIEATGSVTVDGILEAATVISGGDVILRSGAFGNGIGIVNAKGDVFGRFFEKMNIQADGCIFCNYCMQSTLIAMKSIVVTGTTGTVIGGNIYALESVECMSIGNEKNTRTIVRAGITKEILVGYNESMEMMKTMEEMIGLLKEKQNSKEHEHDPFLREQIAECKQAKKEHREKIRLYERLLKRAEKAHIICNQTIFPGTILDISTEVLDISSKRNHKMYYVEDYVMEVSPEEILR